MAPVRPADFEYEFSPRSLLDVRQKLGLSQAKLAELVEVPVNTISRWETGATTPDAHSLAAIYSIARQRGYTPEFFKRRASAVQDKQKRTRLVLMWDFQNKALDAEDVEEEWEYMSKYLNLVFPRARSNQVLKAYISPVLHQRAGEVLRLAKFQPERLWEDADRRIIEDSKVECGLQSPNPSTSPFMVVSLFTNPRTAQATRNDVPNPDKVICILVTNDGDYVSLLKELQQAGVDVYLWADGECSEQLRRAVGQDNFIHWDKPFVVVECLEVVRQLKGKPVTRAEFGNLCRQKLVDSGIGPEDVGFSKRNPYGSLLNRLERQGIVSVTPVPGKPDGVAIRIISQ